MDLTEKLIILRKQSGLTQMDLAEKLEVSRQTISRWEVGTVTPTTGTLRALAELYGVTVDCLLNDDAELSPKETGTLKEVNTPEENSIVSQQETKTKKWMLPAIILIAIAIIATILISAFVPRSQDPEQAIPLDDMYIDETEDYNSDGTFAIDPP